MGGDSTGFSLRSLYSQKKKTERTKVRHMIMLMYRIINDIIVGLFREFPGRVSELHLDLCAAPCAMILTLY